MTNTAFEKTGTSAPNPNTGSVGGAVFLGFSVFLDRLAFYGFRGILLLFLMDVVVDMNTYSLSMTLATMVPILAGFVTDYFLDKRYALLGGATAFFLGICFLGIGGEFSLLLGLSLIGTGTGFTKIAHLSYFGHLAGGRGGKLDGAYSLLYLCINLGALLSALLMMVFRENLDYASIFIALGAIGFLHILMIVIGLATGILPSETDFLQPHEPRPVSRLAGLGFFPLIIGFLASLYFILGRIDSFSPNLFIGILMFFLLGCGFLLFCLSPGSDVVRRNLYVLIVTLGSVMVWAAMDLGWQYFYQFRTTADSDFTWSNNLELAMGILACLVIGVLLLISYSVHAPRFRGSTMRIMIGMALSFFAVLVFALVPLGINVLVIAAVLFAIGEALFTPTIYSTLWQISPARLRGTAIGFYLSATYFSSILASIFEAGYVNFEEDSSNLPVVGILLYGSAAVLLGVLAFLLLRNYKVDNEQQVNPFA